MSLYERTGRSSEIGDFHIIWIYVEEDVLLRSSFTNGITLAEVEILEVENKHQQTVKINGLKAQKVYTKKSNDSQLMFAYRERFLVTVNSTNMNIEDTWQLTKKLNLEDLTDLAK